MATKDKERKKEEKKSKEEKEKKKVKNGEISQDWFEDHESYDEALENQENEEDKEKLSEEDFEELEEKLEEEEEFNSRVRHFLSNQKKDVSLEKMLEVSESSLEENVPKKKEEINPNEDNFDYMAGNKIEEMKYETFEPDTRFSRPDMSSSERILEEQKALYSHLKNTSAQMITEDKNEWNPVTPEATKRKDYLTKKRVEGSLR